MNALEQVAAVRRAQVVVDTEWTPETEYAVRRLIPEVAKNRDATLRDWAVTVEVLRREWETETMAAERIARYMTLHAERWDSTPTLNTLRRTL